MNIKRVAVFFAATLAFTATAIAQPSARPENAPFVTDPEVLRWKSVLESGEREVYAKRAEIVAAADAKPGMTVADIGAGTGVFSLLFASAVGPSGRVYAVDIPPALVAYVRDRARREGLANVTGVVDSATDAALPVGAIDLAFICDTYHHFDHPREMLDSILRALKPGARLIVVDFERVPGKSPQWLLNHVRAGKEQVIAEIEAAGFRFIAERRLPLRENYFLVFSRP